MVPPWHTILQLQAADGGSELGSWQIGVVAFAFVAWILIVTAILEKWEVRLHA